MIQILYQIDVRSIVIHRLAFLVLSALIGRKEVAARFRALEGRESLLEREALVWDLRRLQHPAVLIEGDLLLRNGLNGHAIFEFEDQLRLLGIGSPGVRCHTLELVSRLVELIPSRGG